MAPMDAGRTGPPGDAARPGVVGRGRRLLRQLGDDIVATLFPAECLHCEAPLEEDALHVPQASRRWSALWRGSLRREILPGVGLPLRLLCPTCCMQLRRATAQRHCVPGTQLPSVVAFEPSPVLFRLIHAFKYEACRELAAFLGGPLAGSARRHGVARHPGVLVPLPLHRTRLRQRGYNQAQLLAERVSRALRVPTVTDALERQRATAPLAQMEASERWQHVAGAFRSRRRLPAAPTRVWLLDDVVTSGATVRAAQQALHDVHLAGVLSLCRAH